MIVGKAVSGGGHVDIACLQATVDAMASSDSEEPADY